jgi:5-methylcytosine-specific restriction endonuclease McrA
VYACRICGRVGPDRACPAHNLGTASSGWSKRDRTAQHHFRQAVLHRDGYACTQCGNTAGLQAHHVRPGYALEDGLTLCRGCHRDADGHAR